MFVAFLGIPGVGKTTVAEQLSRKLEGSFFGEPSRQIWPGFIGEFFDSRAFEVLTWFRCFQVEALVKCASVAKHGLAFTDAYYHKILADYIASPNSNWIISPDDAYFEVFRRIVEVDRIELPNADKIVFLTASFTDWRLMLENRGGIRDETVLESAYLSQADMLLAARAHAHSKRLPILVVEHRFGCLDATIDACQNFVLG